MFNQGGGATIRGVLRDCSGGIYNHYGTIDARDVDWGGGLGPGMDGNPPASDTVTYYPWVGAVPLPTTASNPTPTSVLENSKCKANLFIGLRGSGQDPGLGHEIEYLWTALKRQLPDTYLVQLTYPAAPVPYTDMPSEWTTFNQIGDFAKSAWQGSIDLIGQIDHAVAECGDEGQRVFLAGYSQGAWVIHAALNYLNAIDSKLLDHISGVALIADPLRADNNQLDNIGTANSGGGIATSQLGNVTLSINHLFQSLRVAWVPSGPNIDLSNYTYPSSLTSKTVELCNAYDAVCDFRNMEADYPLYFLGAFKGGLYVHSNYGEAQLMEVAQVLLREAS